MLRTPSRSLLAAPRDARQSTPASPRSVPFMQPPSKSGYFERPTQTPSCPSLVDDANCSWRSTGPGPVVAAAWADSADRGRGDDAGAAGAARTWTSKTT